MRVMRAIEILTKYGTDYLTRLEPDFDDAVKLSVEALKRHRNCDYLTYNEMYERLPGEDKT